MTFEEADKAILEIVKQLKGSEEVRFFSVLVKIESEGFRIVYNGHGCPACAAEVIMNSYKEGKFQHNDYDGATDEVTY